MPLPGAGLFRLDWAVHAVTALLDRQRTRWFGVKRVRVVLADRARKNPLTRVQRCGRCRGSGLLAWRGWCVGCAGTGTATDWHRSASRAG